MILKMFKTAVLNLFLLIFAHSGFAAEKLSVFVSIVPQRYFVQQIGNNLVDVSVLVDPGASPHTYEPKPQQMAALSRAQLYLAVGVEFEKAWLPRLAATNPHMRVVHTDHGIHKLSMAAHQHHEEGHPHAATHAPKEHQHAVDEPKKSDHGHDPQHAHDGLDPHIWLSPPLVKQQAATILKALQDVDPGHRNVYQANYNRFMEILDDLDAEIKGMFAEKQGLQFMVFHPAWGYFAQAYNLRQIPVEIEGKEPKPAELQDLITHARNNNINIIFVQPQFSARSAELIAREIDGQVVFADPLAADWLTNLQQVAARFKAALK